MTDFRSTLIMEVSCYRQCCHLSLKINTNFLHILRDCKLLTKVNHIIFIFTNVYNSIYIYMISVKSIQILIYLKKNCMSGYMVLFDCKLYSYFCLYLFIYFITKFDCSKIRHGIKISFANKSCF